MSLFGATRFEKKERTEPMDSDTKEALERTRRLATEIVIQVPYRSQEGLKPKLFEWAIQWVNAGMMLMPMRDSFGGFIDLFRAYMCNQFLRDTDRKWLVMIDSDVIPTDPESILRLCAHDLPVVSGIACAAMPGRGVFACVGVKDPTGVARFPAVLHTPAMPAFGVREVECCGAGILAIRRDVLESLQEPPFLLPQDLRLEGVQIGSLRKTEDIYFGEQVRRAGYKLYADFSVQCFHDKVFPLRWPVEQIDETLDAETWDITAENIMVERR